MTKAKPAPDPEPTADPPVDNAHAAALERIAGLDVEELRAIAVAAADLLAVGIPAKTFAQMDAIGVLLKLIHPD